MRSLRRIGDCILSAKSLLDDYDVTVQNWFAVPKHYRLKLSAIVPVDTHDTFEALAEVKTLRTEVAALKSAR